MEVRAWSGIGWWEVGLPGAGIGKVQPAGAVQGLLGGADRQAAWRHRILIPVPTGQVDRELHRRSRHNGRTSPVCSSPREPSMFSGASPGCAALPRPGRLGDREVDRDARATERSAPDAHAATVGERLLLDKRQTEPGARGADARAPGEPLKDTLPLVDRDAGSVVVDGQASGEPVDLQRDLDLPAAPSVAR